MGSRTSARIAAPLDDVTPNKFAHLFDPDDYTAPQQFAAARRRAGSDGLLYPSVRDSTGRCIAAFRPKAVHVPRQRMHLRYRYSAAARAVTDILEIKLH